MSGNKAIFLDRDGTLNKDLGYTYKIKDLKILPGVIEGLKKLSKLGYLFFIVTNQSGIARGFYKISDMKKFHVALLAELKSHNIIIKKTAYCPHRPEDNCPCRKPKNKLVEDLIKKYKINRKLSYFVGDKEEDVLTGKKSKLKTILISKNSNPTSAADIVVKNIDCFAQALS